MTENLSETKTDGDQFAAAISAVEQLPLEDRADGYGHIYETVRAQLERPDVSGSSS